MKSKYSIKYLSTFVEDLEDIIEYFTLKLNNTNAANVFLDKVEELILQRSKSPLAFEKYYSNKQRKYPYYKIIIGNYIIFYVVIGNVMEVRRIIYGKRNINKII